MVQIFASARIPEGLLAKGYLEANGIPVVVSGESEGPYRLAPVFLWVPAELEVQARLLLAEATAGGATAGDSAGHAEPQPE
jgi:hypothetical protein